MSDSCVFGKAIQTEDQRWINARAPETRPGTRIVQSDLNVVSFHATADPLQSIDTIEVDFTKY